MKLFGKATFNHTRGDSDTTPCSRCIALKELAKAEIAAKVALHTWEQVAQIRGYETDAYLADGIRYLLDVLNKELGEEPDYNAQREG